MPAQNAIQSSYDRSCSLGSTGKKDTQTLKRGAYTGPRAAKNRVSHNYFWSGVPTIRRFQHGHGYCDAFGAKSATCSGQSTLHRQTRDLFWKTRATLPVVWH